MKMKATVIAIIAASLLAACTTAPKKDLALEQVRAQLDELKANDELAGYAPLALGEAERALRTAETWTGNNTYRIHLIYMADRRIQIARVVAQRAQLEDEYIRLNEERNDLLVRASQLEAERARFEAEQARLISEAQAEDARRAREEAEAAIVTATMRFAKRQMTWFRHQAEVTWYHDADAAYAAEKKAEEEEGK